MNNENITVLVIDDADEMREYLALLLEDYGFRILDAANGKDGMAILKDNAVDIIMLDLIMPVMSGEEFLTIKQESSALADIPTIVITANEDMQTAMSCIQNGACSYITKPYDMDYVIQQIHVCLGE